MTPTGYIENGEKILFLYNYREYMEWHRLGERDGNVGWVLQSRTDVFDIYYGFGTIEHPITDPITISLVHNEAFDGPKSTPMEIITPIPFEKTLWGQMLESTRFMILDVSDGSAPRYLNKDEADYVFTKLLLPPSNTSP